MAEATNFKFAVQIHYKDTIKNWKLRDKMGVA